MITMKRNCLITFCIIFIFIIGICLVSVFKVSANVTESQNYKYFKSIAIEEGDTLWSIADKYISNEYKGIEEYIEELKSMNGLNSDTIHAGQNLIVAYYSEELK